MFELNRSVFAGGFSSRAEETKTSKTTNRCSPDVSERTVQMVLDRERDNASRRAVLLSIAGKIGCLPEAPEREKREPRQANEILSKAFGLPPRNIVIGDGAVSGRLVETLLQGGVQVPSSQVRSAALRNRTTSLATPGALDSRVRFSPLLL